MPRVLVTSTYVFKAEIWVSSRARLSQPQRISSFNAISTSLYRIRMVTGRMNQPLSMRGKLFQKKCSGITIEPGDEVRPVNPASSFEVYK